MTEPAHEESLPRQSRRVLEALRAAGISAAVRVMPDSTRTAKDAAAAIGCDVGAIASSLVFMADDVPILVLTSGRHRVDTAALAARLGRREIRRASVDEVRTATGQPIGGVSPVAHPAPIETIVDEALADYDRLWAAAGTPHAVFATTFDDLVRVTGGIVSAVDS